MQTRRGDQLSVTLRSVYSAADVTYTVSGYRIAKDDPKQELKYFSQPCVMLIAMSDGTPRTFLLNVLEEGELISCAISTSTTMGRGFTFGSVALQNANQPSALGIVFLSDYVTSAVPLSFPGNGVQPLFNGRGGIFVVGAADPGAGNSLTYTNSASRFLRILSIYFSLTTSAVVATRRVTISGSNGANRKIVANNTQAASLTRLYNFSPIALPVVGTVSTYQMEQLPTEYFLEPSDNYTIAVENMDAGDAIQFHKMQVEQWLA